MKYNTKKKGRKITKCAKDIKKSEKSNQRKNDTISNPSKSFIFRISTAQESKIWNVLTLEETKTP